MKQKLKTKAVITKKAKKKPKYATIKIVDHSYTEITRNSDPEDKFDGDDTSTSHYIKGFKISEGDYDLTVPFIPVSDTNYYLLYVIYSTGDSFHREDGCISFVDLYTSKSAAEIAARRIQDHYDAYKNTETSIQDASVSIKNQAGKTYSFRPDWIGYFESVDDISVDAIQLVDGK